MYISLFIRVLQCPFNHWFYRLMVYLNVVSFPVCRFGCLIAIYWGMFTMHSRFSRVYLVLLFTSIVAMTIINAVLYWRIIKIDVLGRYSSEPTSANGGAQASGSSALSTNNNINGQPTIYQNNGKRLHVD